MNSGKKAEVIVTKYLSSLGFIILNQNWKTTRCEIDIVAQNHNCIHFVEVKYRHNMRHGSAIEYVTAKKTKQLQYAAQLWVEQHQWEGDYQIDIATIDGALSMDNVIYLPSAVC